MAVTLIGCGETFAVIRQYLAMSDPEENLVSTQLSQPSVWDSAKSCRIDRR
jgi:hypothetical protein